MPRPRIRGPPGTATVRFCQIPGLTGVAQPRLQSDEETPVTFPHCESSTTTRRTCGTAPGYQRFNCRSCHRRFNERTNTPFNALRFPTDIVLLAVLWRLRYKLGFRDVAELLLQRGFEVTHETIRDWEFRFTPLLADQLRAKRRGRAGDSWYIDETYVQVAGRWCYLYRAIDHDGVWTRCSALTATSMPRAGFCGGWSRSRSAGHGGSRRTCTPHTDGRFAGSSAERSCTVRTST